ncbi:hypothetical protein ANO11243_082540 [Dothideomycetidae sp. 11243]|nr:hypothetical protein ANO11243_082540 [fungal sp. No.11243]
MEMSALLNSPSEIEEHSARTVIGPEEQQGKAGEPLRRRPSHQSCRLAHVARLTKLESLSNQIVSSGWIGPTTFRYHKCPQNGMQPIYSCLCPYDAIAGSRRTSNDEALVPKGFDSLTRKSASVPEPHNRSLPTSDYSMVA